MILVLCTVLLFWEVHAVTLEWVSKKEGICIGELVSIRCTVTETGTLQWAVESLFNRQDRVEFIAFQDVAGDVFPSPSFEVVNITLISVEQNQNSEKGNLTSLIIINVTLNTIGKRVYCGDGSISLEQSSSVVINSSTIPLTPLFKVSNVTYKIAKYSVLVEWNSSDVQNYTLTLRDDNEILQSENVDANVFNYSLLNLNYSINYSLQIYGSNCAGKGNSQVLSFFEVGCITPSVPINGSASPYLSTEEGAKIKLNCDNGLNEWITCINSTWVTDSQELVCTPPNSPEGSTVCIMCQEEYFMLNKYTTSMCTNRLWSPNPPYTIKCEEGITESPTKSYGNIQEGIELRPNMIVVISIVVVLLVLLFIIALTATLWNHIRKTRIKRNNHAVDNQYVSTAMCPPPCGSSTMATPYTADYELIHEHLVHSQYPTIHSTARTTHSPAPDLPSSLPPPKDSPCHQDRLESPEGTPPPIPPYRGSPGPSPPTHSLSPTSHHPLLQANSAPVVPCSCVPCGSEHLLKPASPIPAPYENSLLSPKKYGKCCTCAGSTTHCDQHDDNGVGPPLDYTSPADSYSFSLSPDHPVPPTLPGRPPAGETHKLRLVYADVVPQQASSGHETSNLPPPSSGDSVGRDTTVYSEVRTDVQVTVTPNTYVPPYRGSPEPLTSLPTIPLSPNSHHSLLKITSPELIATYANDGCSKLPQKDPPPNSLPSYENTPLLPSRDDFERSENPQLQETTPAATHSLSLPPAPSPPILPPRAQTKESRKRLVYTDVVPKKTSRGRHGTSPLPPPASISVGGDTVVYSEVRTNVKVKVTPRVNKYDRLVTLENIMLQIKPLAHRWFDFAAFLELQGLGVQDNHYHSEEKTLELIINRWMIRIGRTPTWQEVAGLVKYSGFPQLADAISGVYVTGQLPTPINMHEENTQQVVPLPLQMMNGDYSQSGDDDDVTPPSPPPPPRPPRGSRAGPAAKDKIPVG